MYLVLLLVEPVTGRLPFIEKIPLEAHVQCKWSMCRPILRATHRVLWEQSPGLIWIKLIKLSQRFRTDDVDVIITMCQNKRTPLILSPCL